MEDLLKTYVIQPRISPFVSSLIFVRKKDYSSRMCVDYIYLNVMRVKHDYPIPIIDEQLHELHRARVFSKVDLRSGYFQISIKAYDFYLTTFHTHNGHYKFKLMPFGLCNAPTTFQSLMNQIFRLYSRKFVLVFFDDIMIYSKS